MFNFCSLYSGSAGNSSYIESDNTKILVDAGVSCKKIVEALEKMQINPEQLDAILVTHEHMDHIQGLGTISKKYNIPVFANQKTWDAMKEQKDKIVEKNRKTFNVNDTFEIGDLEIHSFKTPHDASNSCGFNIVNNNKKISIATDLGHMTNAILDSLQGSKFILLESNYDPEVLKFSKYPFSLKHRIAGENGHLSNNLAGQTIATLINSGLNTVMLGHLSKESNFPELAYKTVLEEMRKFDYDENTIDLSVANRTMPSKIVKVG